MFAQYILEFIICSFTGFTMAGYIVPRRNHHTTWDFWCDRIRSVFGVLNGLLIIWSLCHSLLGLDMPLRIALFVFLGSLGEVAIRYMDYSLRDD